MGWKEINAQKALMLSDRTELGSETIMPRPTRASTVNRGDTLSLRTYKFPFIQRHDVCARLVSDAHTV